MTTDCHLLPLIASLIRYEASEKIGGQFNLAKMVPGKVWGVPLMVTTDVKRHQLMMISDDR